jgi:hypothetical protein
MIVMLTPRIELNRRADTGSDLRIRGFRLPVSNIHQVIILAELLLRGSALAKNMGYVLVILVTEVLHDFGVLEQR